jgi:hypothetical protein
VLNGTPSLLVKFQGPKHFEHWNIETLKLSNLETLKITVWRMQGCRVRDGRNRGRICFCERV